MAGPRHSWKLQNISFCIPCWINCHNIPYPAHPGVTEAAKNVVLTSELKTAQTASQGRLTKPMEFGSKSGKSRKLVLSGLKKRGGGSEPPPPFPHPSPPLHLQDIFGNWTHVRVFGPKLGTPDFEGASQEKKVALPLNKTKDSGLYEPKSPQNALGAF